MPNSLDTPTTEPNRKSSPEKMEEESMATETATMMTLEEWRGSSSAKLARTATLNAATSSLHLQRSGSRCSEIWRKILEAFVPEGYPGSVTPDYLPFQVWDSLQVLLSAIGVGEKSATVIGATFQECCRILFLLCFHQP